MYTVYKVEAVYIVYTVYTVEAVYIVYTDNQWKLYVYTEAVLCTQIKNGAHESIVCSYFCKKKYTSEVSAQEPMDTIAPSKPDDDKEQEVAGGV